MEDNQHERLRERFADEYQNAHLDEALAAAIIDIFQKVRREGSE